MHYQICEFVGITVLIYCLFVLIYVCSTDVLTCVCSIARTSSLSGLHTYMGLVDKAFSLNKHSCTKGPNSTFMRHRFESVRKYICVFLLPPEALFSKTLGVMSHVVTPDR